MKKKYRLIVDFDVKINEKIKGENNSNLNLLLKEFLKDDKAVLDLYKLWLLGDLQSDEHIEAIEDAIQTRDEKELLKPTLEKLQPEPGKYYLDILANNNHNHFEELDKFFGQFSTLKFSSAEFKET
ncbi:MAG: hypothetical protein KAW12_06470 [Candidatus Aminicenantes bacterium]|nr:hypothetical protein [Candidatus Aminicenantes bacterium]